MLVLPSQTPGLLGSHGLTAGDADRSAWTVDAAGVKLSGAAAVNRILAELRGPWPRLAALYPLPPLAWLEGGLYRLVAANRSRLSRIWGDAPAFER